MWPLPAIRSSGELQLLDSFVSSGRLHDEDLQLMYGGLSQYVHKVETWSVRNYHLHVGGLHLRRFKVRSAFKFKTIMYGSSMLSLSHVSSLYIFQLNNFSQAASLNVHFFHGWPNHTSTLLNGSCNTTHCWRWLQTCWMAQSPFPHIPNLEFCQIYGISVTMRSSRTSLNVTKMPIFDLSVWFIVVTFSCPRCVTLCELLPWMT